LFCCEVAVTTVSGDVILRERVEEHEGVPQKHPEPEVYTDWIGTAPVIRIPLPEYNVAEDGSVVVRDTRPDHIAVETAEDGAVTIRVPA
jgi:hypothetical protein